MRLAFRHAVVFSLMAMIPMGSQLAFGAIEPKELAAAREGDFTYFKVRLSVPERPQGKRRAEFRMPQLFSRPVWETPCYAVLDSRLSIEAGPWNTFAGRTRRTGNLSLTLMYLGQDGKWTSEPVTLDLASAGKMDPAPMPSISDWGAPPQESRDRKLPPSQQFAMAQANWFFAAGEQLGDPYGFYSFARLQTLRKAKLELPSEVTRNRNWAGPANRENLYDLATGAHAIQESLQLDRMLRDVPTTEPRTIDVSSLAGVGVPAMPFDQMRKGREPRFSALAKLVPGDQWYLHFETLAKLQELADLTQQWGSMVVQSPDVGSGNRGLRERIQRQICLPATLLSRVLGPAVIGEVALTGSDPFFREGTDLTVILGLKSRDLFKAAADRMWQEGIAAGARQAKIEGVEAKLIEGIATADRAISAYRAFPDNGLAIYSNSLPAIRRVLALRDGAATGSLAETADFKYIRAAWPQESAVEDGFLYLSDSFIRRLTGPETRIKAKRRMEAAGCLRLIGNAALLFAYEHGHGHVPSEPEMAREGALNPADIELPDAGKFSWNPAGAIGAASEKYGTLDFLTPLSEVPIDKITPTERSEYTRFRDSYRNYWRRYFDPIAVRIKVDRTISFEISIAPLLEESRYNELKRLTGAQPAKFDLAGVSTSTLARFQVHLDKNAREVQELGQMGTSVMGRDVKLMDWLGDWAGVWLDDGPNVGNVLKDFWGVDVGATDEEEEDSERGRGSLSSLFDLPLGAAVSVRNPLGLAAFLVALQGMANTSAPGIVNFVPQEPYHGVRFVKVEPNPQGELGRELSRGRDKRTSGTEAQEEPALWYGAFNSAWTIGTQRGVLERAVDAHTTGSASAGASRVIDYAALVIASPGSARQSSGSLEKTMRAYARVNEVDALHRSWLVWRCGMAASADDLTSASRLLALGDMTLPSGGQISFDPDTNQAVSSVYGPMGSTRVPSKAPPSPLQKLIGNVNQVRAWTRFTDEGLLSNLEIERKTE